jgi:hypothetical protein
MSDHHPSLSAEWGRDYYATTEEAHFAHGRESGPFDSATEDSDQSDNLTRRGGIARLVLKLRAAEAKELAIDILDTAFGAMERGDWEALRAALVGWIETAEILARSRRRLGEIDAAREEGRWT